MAGYGQVLISRVYGPGHLDRTSLVNKLDLLYGFRGNLSCGMQRETNHSAGFGSSCPLTELTIWLSSARSLAKLS